MKTPRGIEFTHWIGMHLSPRQALALEKFKNSNKYLMDSWRSRFPFLRNVPPIYWDSERRIWKWSDVDASEIRQYVTVCEAMLQAKNSGKET